MAETIVFPDLVAVARKVLTDAGVSPVHGGVPKSRPVRFVQLTRTGGVDGGLVVDGGFLTVDCWAVSQPAAMALAQLVRGVLHAAEGTVVAGVPTVDVDGVAGDPAAVTVYGVRALAAPSDFPDVESGAARVRQAFQIGLRGHATE